MSSISGVVGGLNKLADSDSSILQTLGGRLKKAENDMNSVAKNPESTPAQLAEAQLKLDKEKRAIDAFMAGKKVVQDIFKNIIDMIRQIR